MTRASKIPPFRRNPPFRAVTVRERCKTFRPSNNSSEAENKAWSACARLRPALRRAAKHPGKAESIHDLRVAIRRFKQVLRVYDGLFAHPRKMRRSLREFMDLCGAARNCDIAPEVLTEAGVPPDSALEKRLKRRRARAGRDLVKLLDRWGVHSHVRRWRGWLKAQPGDAPPVPAAAAAFPRIFRRRPRGRAAEAGFRQMHKFRLLVKKFRYTAEILGGESRRIRRRSSTRCGICRNAWARSTIA